MWAVVVLYNTPTDPAAFEKYYAGTHLPLLEKHTKEIGISRSVFEKFESALDGSAPAFYRKAELWFDSREALDRGMATAGFGAVAGDIPKFASGGVVGLIANVAS
ncbi:MAG TPA: EthD family reductase [Gemmatimonadaceae bacterium]|nr:EthD family reductase [Gemmatimonadaceae bacterium]